MKRSLIFYVLLNDFNSYDKQPHHKFEIRVEVFLKMIADVILREVKNYFTSKNSANL